MLSARLSVPMYNQVASSVIRTDEIKRHTIYPYVHSFSNVPSRTAMLCPVSIPDVLPSGLPAGSDFSLVAGLLFQCGLNLSMSPDFFARWLWGNIWRRRKQWTRKRTSFRSMGCHLDVFLHWYGKCTFLHVYLNGLTVRCRKAKNIVNYLRILHRILAPGGVWINLGKSLTPFVFEIPSSSCMQDLYFGILKTTIQTTHQLNSILRRSKKLHVRLGLKSR